MGKKHNDRPAERGNIDLRHVYLDEETDTQLDEYILKQRKISGGKKLKRGEAAVKLIRKGLEVEGIA